MSLNNSYLYKSLNTKTEFKGEYRYDWWGDEELREEIIEKNCEYYNHIDFLLEIKEELSIRIRDREFYPPNFDYFYHYRIYL
jgi:hypothetical protein